jgi:hypothetical protein
MHPTLRHQAVESRFRALVRNADLDPPDDVEYRHDSVLFLWQGPKVAVIVELGDSPCDEKGRPADTLTLSGAIKIDRLHDHQRG